MNLVLGSIVQYSEKVPKYIDKMGSHLIFFYVIFKINFFYIHISAFIDVLIILTSNCFFLTLNSIRQNFPSFGECSKV